jgi:hypothetical protein
LVCQGTALSTKQSDCPDGICRFLWPLLLEMHSSDSGIQRRKLYYVPEDSYLRNIFNSFNDYSTVVRPMALYFRHVNQSDPDVQQQMIAYVKAMEALPRVLGLDDDNDFNMSTFGVDGGFAMDKIRPFCWVRDFQHLEGFLKDQPPIVLQTFQNMTFNEQLDFALSNKVLREVYGQDIVRDENGNVVASRCFLFLQDLDLRDVEAQIDMLNDQYNVTKSQPINQMSEHQKDWAFFAFDELFGYWEAVRLLFVGNLCCSELDCLCSKRKFTSPQYSVSVNELFFTIVAGVIAVTIFSFVCLPHWTGAALVCPLIVMLYVNMLGKCDQESSTSLTSSVLSLCSPPVFAPPLLNPLTSCRLPSDAWLAHQRGHLRMRGCFHWTACGLSNPRSPAIL